MVRSIVIRSDDLLASGVKQSILWFLHGNQAVCICDHPFLVVPVIQIKHQISLAFHGHTIPLEQRVETLQGNHMAQLATNQSGETFITSRHIGDENGLVKQAG